LALEVDGHEGECIRNWQLRGGEDFAFPGLRGGMVDFENVNAGEGIAQREGVEAGAKDQRLTNSVVAHAGSENILAETRTADHERTQCCRERFARGCGCALEFRAGVRRKNRHSEGVFEDERARIMQLVCRATHGDTKSGA